MKAGFFNIKGLIENKRAIADIKSHSTITIDSMKTASSAQASELEDVAATDIEASSIIFVATLSIYVCRIPSQTSNLRLEQQPD